ncbi:MAG: ATP-binding protein [Campylobacterota bacterium]|nr:ATP-binding protein [Campylobacterota bacterium]
MYNIKFYQSLQFVLGVIVISIITIALVVQFSYMHSKTKNRLQNDIKYQSKISTNQLKNNISPFIESYSIDEYEKILNTEFDHKSIFAIVVVDFNMAKVMGEDRFVTGKIRDKNWNIVTANEKQNAEELKKSYLIESSDILSSNGVIIGTITVYSSDKYLNKELNQLLSDSLYVAFFIYLFLILSLFYIIKYFILEPIFSVVDSIQKRDDDGIPINRIDIVNSNEIGLLSNTINTMLDKIVKSKSAIESKTKEQEVLLSLFDLGELVLFKWNNDDKWSVDYVSNSVTQLLGYTKEEFLNHDTIYAECIASDYLEIVQKEVQEAVDKNLDFFQHNNYKVITKDGDLKWIRDYTLILRDENNNVVHFLGYITDITDEIYKNNLLLEQSKLASMGEMIGNIAHQWRQPLSVISTAASGMKMQQEYQVLKDEDIPKMCDAINDNAQYLSKTIDDFRNFIKGDREKGKFNLAESINSFISLVESTIKNNNINIVLDLEKSMEIDGYKNELTQCIINIFNNSKDALKEKMLNNEDRLIFISTIEDNNKAIIKIQDNAGGIPEDILPKIFEPYFTTKHKSQGTGLGLHMSYKLIVEGMNGTIEASNKDYTYDNKKYTGALFTITLPLS